MVTLPRGAIVRYREDYGASGPGKGLKLTAEHRGTPTIFCFSTCVDSIRTIPTLQHDPMRAEDLDTSQEDHCADEWRYACMSRQWAKPLPQDDEKQQSGYAAHPSQDSGSYNPDVWGL
jgi:hypothetical protein